MRETAKQEAGAVKAKATSQTLIAANTNRVAAFITNEGANPVNLALGPTAVKEKGPWLAKEGGNITIDGALYAGVISVVTKEGESNVTFSEV